MAWLKTRESPIRIIYNYPIGSMEMVYLPTFGSFSMVDVAKKPYMDLMEYGLQLQLMILRFMILLQIDFG